jgi:Ca2+-transporting ATPase
MDPHAPAITGLPGNEARRRLAAEGPNQLPSDERRGALALAAGVLREPMFLLLLGAAAVYLVLGDLREALVLAASVVVVLAITIVQERRTEDALGKLRDLSSPRALVVRDGIDVRIAGSEVVRGDVMRLREGDRVAADALLLESGGLLVDESLLTGESVPVARAAGDRVFSGTLVVKATALAQVTATGPRSELGRIGTSLAGVDRGKTSLETETARLVRLFALGALAICVLVGALYATTRDDTLGGILAGITLAMAMLPEEFPVVLTVFLALGAWRISKHGVLTRRMSAIEMLGAATVLCCDKTGTLTENRMTVVEAWTGGSWREAAAWTQAEAPVLEAAALACEPSPFDPMERAILEAALRIAPSSAALRAEATLERHYPFGEGFLAMCLGWRPPSGAVRVAMKGAPETVIALCTLAPEAREAALREAAAAAARGLRLLAVATAGLEGDWPGSPAGFRFAFLGFIALADPVRTSVPAAVALCRRAGIRVVMITGDHPETARAIARQAGIDPENVYARVRPEQKLAIVNALRDNGEIVAMTGDGVNDAPALKAAHIGIAMGRRGTDVAREAASLVLLEDDFTSIVATIRLGRRIYDNIRNAMRFLVAVHVPLAGMAFIPLAMGWPLFAFPVHVMFLEFVIDPACSIAFEAERSDPHVMERSPRPVGQRLFSVGSFALGVLLGASVLVAVVLVYGVSLGLGDGERAARAAAFVALVCGVLALIVANRSHRLTLFELDWRENKALYWIVALAAGSLLATVYIPAVAGIFRFAPLTPLAFLAAAAAGFASVTWYELLKLMRRN